MQSNQSTPLPQKNTLKLQKLQTLSQINEENVKK